MDSVLSTKSHDWFLELLFCLFGYFLGRFLDVHCLSGEGLLWLVTLGCIAGFSVKVFAKRTGAPCEARGRLASIATYVGVISFCGAVAWLNVSCGDWSGLGQGGGLSELVDVSHHFGFIFVSLAWTTWRATWTPVSWSVWSDWHWADSCAMGR